MMEIDLLVVGAALAWGGLLGFFYFGGLWWTLKRIVQRQRPGLFFGASFSIRTVVVLWGFWMVLEQGLVALFISVGTFTVTRLIMTRRLGEVKENLEKC